MEEELFTSLFFKSEPNNILSSLLLLFVVWCYFAFILRAISFFPALLFSCLLFFWSDAHTIHAKLEPDNFNSFSFEFIGKKGRRRGMVRQIYPTNHRYYFFRLGTNSILLLFSFLVPGRPFPRRYWYSIQTELLRIKILGHTAEVMQMAYWIVPLFYSIIIFFPDTLLKCE